MTDKRKEVHKSFEELKSNLFPNLVDRERTDRVKKDIEKFGSCLANKSIDQILKSS